MFKSVRLRNYRTHIDTQIKIAPITLLIGNNGSGKSNFFAGLNHFSKLIARGRPIVSDVQNDEQTALQPQEGNMATRDYLREGDLFPHRHRLCNENDEMSFSCIWEEQGVIISYEMTLFPCAQLRERVACKELLTISGIDAETKSIGSGFESFSDKIQLRRLIETATDLSENAKRFCRFFFRDCAQFFFYHFQPATLKSGKSIDFEQQEKNGRTLPILSMLGNTGERLLDVIYLAKTRDQRAFERFVAQLRRFERSFHGVRYHSKKNSLVWEFDLGSDSISRLDEFPTEVVNDGFIKAAAVSLLTSMHHPPALILLEEIENGINPGNIQEFLAWMEKATRPGKDSRGCQIIITSHSPSVLREFHTRLDAVYTFRLDKNGYRSDIRNLHDALDMLVGIGAVEGDFVDDQTTKKKTVNIPKYQLTELWYSGTIG